MKEKKLSLKQKKMLIIAGIILAVLGRDSGDQGSDRKRKRERRRCAVCRFRRYADGTGLGTQNRFSGVVEAQDTLKLTLSDDQKVKEIFVEKGQEVKPGTKLYEFDTEELAMTLEQRNLELDKINNSISNLNNQIATLTAEKKNAPASEQLSYTTQIQELQTNVKQEEYNYKVKELEVKPYEKRTWNLLL